MKTVLVIEDDEGILDVISILLEMEGYQVHCDSSGADAFNTVFTSNPDVILLDVMLGELDGRVICKELKTHPATKHIPIIMISASHHIDTSYWLADDFIPKPFNIDHLAETVGKYIDKAHNS